MMRRRFVALSILLVCGLFLVSIGGRYMYQAGLTLFG